MRVETAGNDLDSIRALFSEKEKELSLAVAKVESLTKQLEEIKRDRRGPLHLLQASTINYGNGNNNGKHQPLQQQHNQQQQQSQQQQQQQQQLNGSAAARELDKLRKELMVSNECQMPQIDIYVCMY